ncbi:MAG TPA: hypothetical protein V6D10_20835 [Trichocoleus sp.]|jgi:hypothetical protein
MTDSIDDLLAQVKAQYGDEVNQVKQSPLPQSLPTAPPIQSAAQETSQPSGSSPKSLDSLLAELEGKPAPLPPSGSMQLSQPAIDQKSYLPTPLPATNLAADPLLTQLKAKYSELDRAAELEQQKQREAEQRRQEKLRQQQQATSIKRAEEWLKTLDSKGGEGAWFEEFAAKYSSRIEAAIDYLGLNHEKQS